LAGEPFPGLTRNEENGAPDRLNPLFHFWGPKRSEGPAGTDFLFRDEWPQNLSGARGKNPSTPVSGGPVVVQFREIKGREWLSLAEQFRRDEWR